MAILQQIRLEKQQNLFVQGYNHIYLAVHFIMKHGIYKRLIISRVYKPVLCDVISRSHNSLSTPSFTSFSPCLKEYRRTRKDNDG